VRYTEVSFEAEVRFDTVPRTRDGYVALSEGLAPRVEEELGAEATLMRSYGSPDGLPVWVFLGYHQALKTGRQAHSPKHCYPGSGWDIVRDEKIEKTVLGRTVPMTRLLIDQDGRRRLVLYWFETAGRPVANVLGVKLYAVANGLKRGRTDTGFIRVSTPVGPDGVLGAERRIEKFLEVMGGSLIGAMPFPSGDAYRAPGTAEAAS
jgi:EpsI family protein